MIKDRLKSWQTRLKQHLPKAARHAAETARVGMLRRVNQGLDVNLVPFQGYRDIRYKGRIQPVNLRLRGDMQGAVRTRRRGLTGAQVMVTNPRERQKWAWHQRGAGSLPIRQAWGLDVRTYRQVATQMHRDVRSVDYKGGKTVFKITIG